MSLIRTAMPSRIPTIPSCDIGFCSKNSLMKCTVYVSMRKYRVGRRSFSFMAEDMSRTRIRCRIMPL